jgi:uncharacterized membrane protein
MALIDVIQLALTIISIYATVVWLRRMRKYPLTIVAIIALLFNVAFYMARACGLFTPTDLNLFSSVRVLFLIVLIAAIPFLRRVL